MEREGFSTVPSLNNWIEADALHRDYRGRLGRFWGVGEVGGIASFPFGHAKFAGPLRYTGGAKLAVRHADWSSKETVV